MKLSKASSQKNRKAYNDIYQKLSQQTLWDQKEKAKAYILSSHKTIRAFIKTNPARFGGVSSVILYATLCEFTNASRDGRYSRIKQETIALRVGVSRQTVNKAVKILNRMSMIFTKHLYKVMPDGSHRQTINITIIKTFKALTFAAQRSALCKVGILLLSCISNTNDKTDENDTFFNKETGEVLNETTLMNIFGSKRLSALK